MSNRFEGLSGETARHMGIGRAEAMAQGIRNYEGRPLPGDQVVADDFRCDAEQVEIDENNVLKKSSKPVREPLSQSLK